jgi:hypothetical protein
VGFDAQISNWAIEVPIPRPRFEEELLTCFDTSTLRAEGW